MKFRKGGITLLIVVVGMFCFIYVARTFSSGSYPNAETYHMNISEQDLIRAVQDFKSQYPEFRVPQKTQLKDGRNTDNRIWYHVYFYYPKQHQFVYAWTRREGNNKSILALVAINKGSGLGNWLEVNNDLNIFETTRQKKIFEEQILSKIKEIARQNKYPK